MESNFGVRYTVASTLPADVIHYVNFAMVGMALIIHLYHVRNFGKLMCMEIIHAMRMSIFVPSKWKGVVASSRETWLRSNVAWAAAIAGFLATVIFAVFSYFEELTSGGFSLAFVYLCLSVGALRPSVITVRTTIFINVVLLVGQMVVDHAVLKLVKHDNLTAWSHLLLTTIYALSMDIEFGLIFSVALTLSRALSGNGFLIYLVIWHIALNIWHTSMLRSTAQREMMLQSAEDAGHAMFTLLNSRYDAVTEVDAHMKVMNASETFFGLVSASAPSQGTSLSTNLLKIQRTRSAVQAPSASDHGESGLSFGALFTSSDDHDKFNQVLTNLRGQWTDRICDKKSAQIASVLHTTLSLHSQRTVRVQVFISCCHNIDKNIFRYFLGIVLLEELPVAESICQLAVDMAPELPEQRIAVFTVNACTDDLTLLTDLCIDGKRVPAGAKLRTVFTEALFNNVRKYLSGKLEDLRQGCVQDRSWTYGRIGASLNGSNWEDSMTFELVSRTPHPDETGVLEVQVTITRAPRRLDSIAWKATRGSHPSRSSKSSRSSQRHQQSLDSVSEVSEENEDVEVRAVSANTGWHNDSLNNHPDEGVREPDDNLAQPNDVAVVVEAASATGRSTSSRMEL